MLQPIDEPLECLSRAEYLAWTVAQPRGASSATPAWWSPWHQSELVHARLKAAAWLQLRQSIQAHRPACEVFPDGMAVAIDEDDDFVPDAIVRCGERLADELTIVPDPLIVVEVLSPSTSATDRGKKLEKYFRLRRCSIT